MKSISTPQKILYVVLSIALLTAEFIAANHDSRERGNHVAVDAPKEGGE